MYVHMLGIYKYLALYIFHFEPLDQRNTMVYVHTYHKYIRSVTSYSLKTVVFGNECRIFSYIYVCTPSSWKMVYSFPILSLLLAYKL